MQDTSAGAASAIRLIYVKVFGVIAFLLVTTVAVTAEMIPLPRSRPVGIPGDPSTINAETAVSPCRSRLAEIADFKPLPSITGPGDCIAADVVALDAVLLPDRHRIVLSPAATLRCPMAEAVTHWIRADVAPTIAALGRGNARFVRLPPAQRCHRCVGSLKTTQGAHTCPARAK